MSNNTWSNIHTEKSTIPDTIALTTKRFPDDSALRELFDSSQFQNAATSIKIKELRKFLDAGGVGSEALISAIEATVRNITDQRRFKKEEVLNMPPMAFAALSRLSQQKVAIMRLKNDIAHQYQSFSEEYKEELRQIGITEKSFVHQTLHDLYTKLQGFSLQSIQLLYDKYNLSYNTKLFAQVFDTENIMTEETIQDICEEYGMNVEDILNISGQYSFMQINEAKIQKEAFDEAGIRQKITGNYLQHQEKEEDTGLTNGFINPNWSLYGVDAELAIGLWGVEKTKYIFGRYFRKGVENMKFAHQLELPSFYNFSIFRIRPESHDLSGEQEKMVNIAQHIMEWELPEGFSQADFSELVKAFNHVISDFRFSGEKKRFTHPVQTTLGAKKYYGVFSGSKGFENTHIIEIQWDSKKSEESTRVLRFASEMDQDVILYGMIQISHFLRTKTLLPSVEVWREIYDMYNALTLEGVERFDAKTMKEQYDTLVKKVIWPLSREHREEKGKFGKAHNTLLYGVYGTGKSQLMTHIMSEKEYVLPNNKTIHLDANVIHVSIGEFAEMLLKSVSSFRRRLSDIHENTKKPIILVIEDIDTIVKEQGTDSDPVSQAMTTIFEGVGSLPVTVVASTNNLEILPQRHLRPNRLDTLISFEYPLDITTIQSVFRLHWERKGLEKKLPGMCEKIQDILCEKMKLFTPSHVAAFCLSVAETLEFVDTASMSDNELQALITKEVENCLVPVKDMQDRSMSMSQWRRSLNATGWNMGFVS